METNEVSKTKTKKKIQKPEIKIKNWTVLVWTALKGAPSLICILIWQIIIGLVSYRYYLHPNCLSQAWQKHTQLQLCSTEYKKISNLPPGIIVIMCMTILTACQFLIIFLQKHVVKENQTPLWLEKIPLNVISIKEISWS